MAVEFQGKVSAGGVDMYVLPYSKATSGRVVVSLPMKVNHLTLRAVRGAMGSLNYGDADVTAGAYAAFQNIVDTLQVGKFADKYGLIAANIEAADSTVNMIFDFQSRETKVFNSLKTIFAKMTAPLALYREALTKLCTPEGKSIKNTSDGYAAACAALSSGRDGLSVFVSGRVLIKSKDGASAAKKKCQEKLAKAVEALDRHPKESKAAAVKYEQSEMPSTKAYHKIKDACDFYYYDAARKWAQPYGHGFELSREVKFDADVKRRYAEGFAKFKERISAVSAYLASGVGIFTVADLSVFMSSTSVSDIAKSL